MNEIIKTQTETYTLRGNKCTWAKINLDCGKKSVNVMISSDYGDFNYYWGNCGTNPKKFLSGLDWHYCMKKLMNGTDNMYQPDFDKRFKSFKKIIINDRKELSISKNEARQVWEAMINVFENCYDSTDLYYSLVMNERIFWDSLFYDTDSIPEDTKLKPIVMNFWEDVWTPFIGFLKEEIKKEEF